jgi:uncharacterized protein YndB with AHSA1/START domain
MEPRNEAAQAATADRELVMSRVFDAPRALVFKAWTEPEHMSKWFGPKGFVSTVLRSDLRPGGSYRLHMLGPDGDHWLQGVYQEIVEPERLVSTFAWADADGRPTRPETILALTFEDLGGAKTKLTLRQSVFESVNARDQHNEGWTSSFEKLAEYLATQH